LVVARKLFSTALAQPRLTVIILDGPDGDHYTTAARGR
jgi:hypothetical protein